MLLLGVLQHNPVYWDLIYLILCDCGIGQSADRGIIEEVLLMVLEILNSTLTHNLHNNAHLVYSLLYQREIFEPYRTHPSLMDLIQNIETVR